MPFVAGDANRAKFKYIKEVTFGTTPGTNMTEFRYNSHSIGSKASFITSNELRYDRQRVDTILTSRSSDGDVSFEWSYGSPDDLIEGAMQSTWATGVTYSAATMSITAATTSTVTIAGTGMTTFAVGVWVSVSNFAGVNGPRFFGKVYTSSATALLLTHTSLATLATVAAGPSITVQHLGWIRNGVIAPSYTLETEFTDFSSPFIFFNHKGMKVSTMGLNVASEQIVTGTFGFMGLNTVTATATAGGSLTAAPTNDVMGEPNVAFIYEAGVPATAVSFKSVNLTLNNNLRMQEYIGSTFPGGIGSGTIDVTATIQAYFSSVTFYNKFLNNTPTSMALVLQGTNGGSYIVELPQVRLTSATVVPPGINTDIMIDGGLTAYREPVNNYTIQITRVANLP